MYATPINKVKEYIDVEIEERNQRLKLIDYVKTFYPDSFVKYQEAPDAKLYFFDQAVIKHPEVEFKISRKKSDIYLSIYHQLQNYKIRVYYPADNYNYYIENPIIIKHHNCHSMIPCYNDKLLINLVKDPKYKKIIFDKMVDIFIKEKLVPNKQLLEIFPDFGKYIAII